MIVADYCSDVTSWMPWSSLGSTWQWP